MISEAKKCAAIEALKRAFKTQTPFDAMMVEMRRLVSEGVDQQTAMDLLWLIYHNTPEDEQEPICEAMDIVSSNCTPSKRIFPDKDPK